MEKALAAGLFVIIFTSLAFKCSIFQAFVGWAVIALIGAFIWFFFEVVKPRLNERSLKKSLDKIIELSGGQEKYDRDNEEYERLESVLHIPEVLPCDFDTSVNFWLKRIQHWCTIPGFKNVIYEDVEGHKSEVRGGNFLDAMRDDDSIKIFGKWYFEKKSIKSFIAFREFISSSGIKGRETYFVELNLDDSPKNPYRIAEQNQQRWAETIQQEVVEKSPYEVLGVSEQATAEEIHEAFHKKALENHPDRTAGLGEEYKQLAEKRMKEINNAYDILRKEL